MIETVFRYRDRIRSLASKTRSTLPAQRCLTFLPLAQQTMYPNPVHIHVDPPCDETVLVPRNLIQACPALVGVHVGFIDQDEIQYLSASTARLGIFGNGLLSDGIGNELEVMRVRLSNSLLTKVVHPKYFTVATTLLKTFQLTSRSRI
jgi:hypothetical protein